MQFTKMHGCGNDFVVTHVDTAKQSDALQPHVASLCDRRRGVGADGVVVVLPSESADLRMRIFNADGSEAEMCGNGIRCAFRYAARAGIAQGGSVRFETLAGVIRTASDGDLVRVDMGRPVLEAKRIPVADGGDRVVMKQLEVDGETVTVTAVSMGNPHAVIYADALTDELVLGLGSRVEPHPYFPRKTNVELVRVDSPAAITMRVFERGVGETLACGTGACAAVVAGVLNDRHATEVTVHLRGGDLRVAWDGDPSHSVLMTGPAVTVFSGTVDTV
ncbi:MAG: diaminopimelate epimerase [Chitinivibrionales bacterium]|nr:diaminopimelate epimerase [Chitinivibrionales bacterium]